MATNWVLGKVSDALAPTVASTVSTAGSFAGGAVSAVGSSINGVGAGINNSIRRYGDGAMDYGNSIRDWTKADGIRAQTASNPLGLASGAAGGKRGVTAPSIYSAPTKTPSKQLTTTSKTVAPQKKSIDAPKKTTSVAKSTPPPKKAVTGVKTSTPVKTGSGPKGGAVTKKTTPAVKSSTGSVGQPSKGAANPLGLPSSFM